MATLFIEIGQSSLKVLNGDNGLELPLERSENGRLTSDCRARLVQTLAAFLKAKRWRRPRAFCAIGARGVSLRRITVPSAEKEELQRLLALQIESQFPLPPADLAWGYRPLDQGNGAPTSAGQELLVAAVKRTVIEEYSDIFAACGVSAVFTLGAFARSSVCPQPRGSYAVLDIGRAHSELICFENSVPASVRIIPWGGENVTRAIARNLSITHDEAEKLKISSDQTAASSNETRLKIESAVRAELRALVTAMTGHWTGQKLFLTGRSVQLKPLATWLGDALGGYVHCEAVEVSPSEGQSAATLGLKRFSETNGSSPLFVLEAKAAKPGESAAPPSKWKWAVVAALLAIVSVAIRYMEPLAQKPRLAKRIAEIRAQKEKLPKIDRDLGFLQFVSSNQPPYLDTMVVLAHAAPAGSRIESFSMNRSGDVALRATMQNVQASEFRSKLALDSGLFSLVSLDDQTPGQDQQRVTVRISAQVKPPSLRPTLGTNFLAPRENRGGGEPVMFGPPPGGGSPGPSRPSRRGGPPPSALPPNFMPQGGGLPPGAMPPGVEIMR